MDAPQQNPPPEAPRAEAMPPPPPVGPPGQPGVQGGEAGPAMVPLGEPTAAAVSERVRQMHHARRLQELADEQYARELHAELNAPNRRSDSPVSGDAGPSSSLGPSRMQATLPPLNPFPAPRSATMGRVGALLPASWPDMPRQVPIRLADAAGPSHAPAPSAAAVAAPAVAPAAALAPAMAPVQPMRLKLPLPEKWAGTPGKDGTRGSVWLALYEAYCAYHGWEPASLLTNFLTVPA